MVLFACIRYGSVCMEAWRTQFIQEKRNLPLVLYSTHLSKKPRLLVFYNVIQMIDKFSADYKPLIHLFITIPSQNSHCSKYLRRGRTVQIFELQFSNNP